MKKIILLLLIISVVLLAGCTTTTQTFQENDNALKMEIKSQTVRPSLKFDVKVPLESQVAGTLRNVRIQITNPDGLDVIGACGSLANNACVFNEIAGFDVKEARFTLRAPSREELGGVGTTKHPKFTLKYDYVGETVLLIPIVEPGTKTESKSTSFPPKTGPVHAIITKGTSVPGEETEVTGLEVESPGSIFAISLKFEDKLNQDNSNVIIRRGDFALELTEFSVSREVGFDRCDFNVNGNILTLTEDVRVRDGKVFVCSLQSSLRSVKGGVVTGSIIANFPYTYTLAQEVPVEIIMSLV